MRPSLSKSIWSPDRIARVQNWGINQEMCPQFGSWVWRGILGWGLRCAYMHFLPCPYPSLLQRQHALKAALYPDGFTWQSFWRWSPIRTGEAPVFLFTFIRCSAVWPHYRLCLCVVQSYPAVCDPTDCSTPGFPILHYFLELTQIHVHCVGDAIQPSHSLLPRSPALSLPSISKSFPVSQLFPSGGHSIGAPASASVLPMNIQGWFPLGWTDLIFLQSKGFLGRQLLCS